YKSHSDSVVVTCKAGSVVVLNQKVFHSVGPNRSRSSREMFAVSYRPAWASPIEVVPEPDDAAIRRLPVEIQRFFSRPNVRSFNVDVNNWEAEMPNGGLALGPGRWND